MCQCEWKELVKRWIALNLFSQENMEEVCSLQLLTSVRRMVLALTQQKDESKEFVRFFHRQLGSILQVWHLLAHSNTRESEHIPYIRSPLTSDNVLSRCRNRSVNLWAERWRTAGKTFWWRSQRSSSMNWPSLGSCRIWTIPAAASPWLSNTKVKVLSHPLKQNTVPRSVCLLFLLRFLM